MLHLDVCVQSGLLLVNEKKQKGYRMASVPPLKLWNKPLDVPRDCKQTNILSPSTGGWFGSALPVQIHSSTTPGLLSVVSQGADFFNRIGRRINLVHLQAGIVIEETIIDRAAIARVMVVYWKETQAAVPFQETTLYRNLNVGDPVFAPRAMALHAPEWPDVTEEGEILFDTTLNFPRFPAGSTSPVQQGLVNIDIPLGMRYTNFGSASANDVREGSLWLYVFDTSDPAARTLTWKSLVATLYYVDR